jgi:hypothetical protein
MTGRAVRQPIARSIKPWKAALSSAIHLFPGVSLALQNAVAVRDEMAL